MLKLRRIELFGFKSFYERSNIDVNDSGVTAVVGPNGCGKSNISDAVAWVLGEQRARSLRGDRMEDVIFNGSGRRSPLGMAEVTISLVDDSPPHSNGGPPPGPIEVTVQRRLYRSGESNYLLNGRPCRLLDIQDVFLGTGLGPNSYAIVEQGRIGQLLSARPADRRTVIEEAAGVTKFKAKRKLAESRLQAARNNLARVSDILSEVERQRNSLKRQASKAARYRDVKKRMREVLGAVFSTRAEMLIEGEERVAAALAGISDEGRRLEARVRELDGAVHRSREEVEAGDRRLESAREVQVTAKLDLEKTSQRIERFQDQEKALEGRSRELIAEKDRLGSEIDERRSESEAGVERLKSAEASLSTARDQLRVAEEALVEIGRLRGESEAAIEVLRDRRFEIVGREAEIGNEISGKEELIRRLDRQVERFRAEEDEVRRSNEACRAQLAAAELVHSSRQAEVQRLALERDRVETEFGDLRRELEAGQIAAAEARSEEEKFRHRLETIRELSLDRAYGTESVQQFFNHLRDEPWAPMGIVADFLDVDPDDESVIEHLLHNELQYVVVEDLVHAERALAIARRATHGRLDFLVADAGEAFSADPVSIAGAIAVSDRIRLDPRLRFFRNYLANTYVVPDLAQAWHLSRQHPELTFVARTGEVVRDRVISWGERSSHGPLALKREMRDLDRHLEDARRISEGASETLAALTASAEEADRKRQDLAYQLQEAEKQALGLDHGLRTLTSDLQRTQGRIQLVRAELTRFADERTELESTLVSARSDLETVRAQKSALDEEIAARNLEGRRFREDQEARSGAAAEIRSQLAVLEERRETISRDLQSLEFQVAQLNGRVENLEQQIAAAGEDRQAALSSIREEEKRREELTIRGEELQLEIGQSLGNLENLRSELREAETGWDQARTALDSWKDRHNQLDIEKAEIASDLKHLVSLCMSELGEPIESVCLDSFETLTPEELEQRDTEYIELRHRVDSMGAVNMMAVEEYEEAAERFDFLTAQRQDLLDSIRDTAQAIQEIDSVCQQQFSEAFKAINSGFSDAFVELFGGGHGQLRLIEHADQSDAGIEIVAQPPGKKLQNVLLLSGGEKALTSLALVIALFRYKPSPFCVLDEVDAPLDEINVDRFANLIRVMSDETQFIVITHSKRTMETANQLYGVTMEEPGVSKVVSVRLN